MDKSYIPKLEQLPRTIKQNLEGHSILFIHYQIENHKMNAHINNDPFCLLFDRRFHKKSLDKTLMISFAMLIIAILSFNQKK